MRGVLWQGALALGLAMTGLSALAAATISVNFNSAQGKAPEGYGIVPARGWNNLSGKSGTDVRLDTAGADDAKITWSAPGIYQWTTATEGALKGYLDDNSTTARISIKVTDIPFACYDAIIYQATDDIAQFNPPKVNGLYYSYDGTRTTGAERSADVRYGESRGLVAEYGRNVMWIHNLSGDLDILGCMPKMSGTSVDNSEGRGCIAALQLVDVTSSWGNMGFSSGAGYIDTVSSQNMPGSYEFTFADQSGVYVTGIGMTGEVSIRQMKLVLADSDPVAPQSITITDGDASIKSTGDPVVKSGTFYGSSTSWTRQIATYSFSSDITFDTSKRLQMRFTGSWRGTVAKPVNRTCSDGTWSPVFLVSGVFTAPRSLAVNFNSSSGSARSGSGLVPAATWNNIAGATVTGQELKLSDGTVAGYLSSSGTTKSWTTNVKEPLLKGFIDGSAASEITISSIPFDNYDVIVYQATDLANGCFNPPAINGRYYSHDGELLRLQPNDTALRYGESRQIGPICGLNATYVRGGFSGNLKISGAGNLLGARGGIAGVQLVEASAPQTYRATVSKNTDWNAIQWSPSPWNGLESNAQLLLTVTGNPTITFTEPFALGANSRLTVVGDGVPVVKFADGAFEDGCWEKTFLTVSTNDAPNVTFAPLKAGFTGGYERTDTGFLIRAQNREVISVNFAGGSPSATSVPVDSPAENKMPQTGDLFGLAPVAGTNWNEIARQWKNSRTTVSLTKEAVAFDGSNVVRHASVSVSATADSTSQSGDVTNPLLRGYLDDGVYAENGADVVIHGIPYTAYDVIVYGTTDDRAHPFAPVFVNGRSYTFKDGATVEGTEDWGEGLYGAPELGKNALRITGCVGDTVTISGVRSSTGGRATFAAVQIVSQGETATKTTYSATVSQSTNFSDITWDKPFEAGQLNEATVRVGGTSADEVNITFDDAGIMLGKLTVISSRDVRLTASAALSHVGQIDLSQCTGKITYGFPVAALQMTAGKDGGKIAYVGGSGTSAAPAPISFVEGGVLTLAEKTAPYYIGSTYCATQLGLAYAMTFTNAAVYANGAVDDRGNTGLAVGNAAVVVAGDSVVTARNVVLGSAQADQASSLTVRDSAQVIATGAVNAGDASNAVLFGKVNGPTTFTLQDDASFTAASDVLVGLAGGEQTINVRGGVFKARGIVAAAAAAGPNVINLDGGELVLGASGITAKGTKPIAVVVGGDAQIASSADMKISQAVKIGAGKTLTFAAANGTITLDKGSVENDGTNVIASGTVSLKGLSSYQGSGTIVVKGGATLDYGGFYLVNPVIVEDGGAVVNTGTAMTADKPRMLSLAGNAVIGGPAEIRFGPQSQIDLNGHSLTIARQGRLSLSLPLLTNGATVVVGADSQGTLATGGATVLEDIDLVVSSWGTLDLSSGTSLTCRNFKSAGKTVGSVAKLIVKGTLDASGSTCVGRLELADGATLEGSGLEVDGELKLGSVLNVVSSALRPGRIAVVPEGTTVGGTTLVYNGRRYYKLVCSGTTLSVAFNSNNWIGYADAAGAYREGDVLVVTNAEGFAWVAASTADTWLSGSVALGADIDLSRWNWTPVAQFTGVFDGRGHVISGLNNTNVVAEYGACYPIGPTNDWGLTAYGLFASATNATFRNVTLADVAISNAADSVAALLGVHAGGDLTVANVANASGCVRGDGACRAVAGLVTIGCSDNAVGHVVVTGNVSRATIVGAIANGDDGGNVAQILAGTTWGTTFGTVVATNNVGGGKFDVRVTDSGETFDWDRSYFSWFDLPVCNLAAAVMRTDDVLDFWHFVEANDPQSVPVDPVRRTARMTAGEFANGTDNIAGWWIDTISCLADGGEITLAKEGNTLDVWQTIDVDRSITLDLHSNCAYGLYDCDLFSVAAGKTLTIKNGSLYYAHGYSPTTGEGAVVLDATVKTAEIPGADFFARTVPISDLAVQQNQVFIDIPYTSLDFYYVVDSTPTLAEDWTLNVAAGAGNGSSLTLQVPAAGESGFYRVRISNVKP